MDEWVDECKGRVQRMQWNTICPLSFSFFHTCFSLRSATHPRQRTVAWPIVFILSRAHLSFLSSSVSSPTIMKLVIAPRSAKSRKFPITLDLAGSPADVKVETVQAAIEAKFPELYVDRQRLTAEKVALEAGKTLSDYGLKDGDSVTFKDLGTVIDDISYFFFKQLQS